MGKINWQRVILGGLLAGVIIDVSEGVVNGFIFADDWAVVLRELNRPGDLSMRQIGALNIWGFVTGITTIWLYAAIRPRYGPGPKTAICAGAAMWFTTYFLGGVFPLVSRIFPVRLWVITTLIGLVEVMIAALAGASLYKE